MSEWTVVFVAPNKQTTLWAEARAGKFQKVTIKDGSTENTFTGQGEGVTMKAGTGSDTLTLPAQSQGRLLWLRFDSSNSSSGPWSLAKAALVNDVWHSPQTGNNFIEVKSEDQDDNDFNDAVLFIQTT